MAKRFRFQLETLLKVRRLREREAQRKVAAKYAELARLDETIRQTSAAISEQQAALLAAQRAPRVETLQLSRGRAWVGYLRSTALQQQALRAARARELETLQAELRDARTQTRVLEKLRERRWTTYLHERKAGDQAAADELAQQLHNSEDAEIALAVENDRP